MQTYAAITILGAAVLAALSGGIKDTPPHNATVQAKQMIELNNTQVPPVIDVAPGGAQQHHEFTQPATNLSNMHVALVEQPGVCKCDPALAGKVHELELGSAARDRQIGSLQNDLLALQRAVADLKTSHTQAEVPKEQPAITPRGAVSYYYQPTGGVQQAQYSACGPGGCGSGVGWFGRRRGR